MNRCPDAPPRGARVNPFASSCATARPMLSTFPEAHQYDSSARFTSPNCKRSNLMTCCHAGLKPAADNLSVGHDLLIGFIDKEKF